MNVEVLIVDIQQTFIRLDSYLASQFPTLSRTYFQWLIQEGLVIVNSEVAKKSLKLYGNEEIEVQFAAHRELTLEPIYMPLDILYEDDFIMAVNKPAGLVVHPGPGHYEKTFVHGLLYYCKNLYNTDPIRPGIVHRLDKDTTGVLIAAKNVDVQRSMMQLFKERKIEKEYRAILQGSLPMQKEVAAPIGRDPLHRKKMAVCIQRGKAAHSIFIPITASESMSYVQVLITTGRTHQIRVHAAHIHRPIVGDDVYGKAVKNIERPLLHCYRMKFFHPIMHKEIEIYAPIPLDIQTIINRL